MAVLCFFFFAGDRLEDKVQLPDHGIRALPYQPFGEVAVAEGVVLTQRFRATLQGLCLEEAGKPPGQPALPRLLEFPSVWPSKQFSKPKCVESNHMPGETRPEKAGKHSALVGNQRLFRVLQLRASLKMTWP
jgi:hypothetical protein